MGPKHSLRTYVGIAARATGRRDHRHAAALRRGRSYVRIDARRRANDAVGTRQLLAQRLAGGFGSLRLVVLSDGEALLRAGFRIAHGPPNQSLSPIEPVSSKPKRKSENNEQRLGLEKRLSCTRHL